jgi:hypothetical protein
MFDLSLEVLRVVEEAAIASARTMGMGDPKTADHAAVESMRRCLDTIAIDGTIVIGEGERDAAPMLFIGEKVGSAKDQQGALSVDIAVDPLEGTNLCSTGAGGAITVLAASERGGLLHAPDCYMEKIVVGPAAKGAVDLEAPVKHNLKAIARRLQRGVDDLVVVVLDRPRHQQLIADIREAGARIRLIGDGDLSAGIASRRGRHGSARGDGVGRRARRRAYRRGPALPERRNSGPAGGEGRSSEGAHAGHGHPRYRKDLHHQELAPGTQHRFRRQRRDRRQPAAGRPVLRRRHAHAVHRDDAYAGARAFHRYRTPGEQAGREGAVPVTACSATNCANTAWWARAARASPPT